MKVSVRLFAVARQVAGRDQIELDLPEGATVAQLRAALGEQLTGLAPALSRMMFAINNQYAGDGAAIPAGAEIACIPPVSGG